MLVKLEKQNKYLNTNKIKKMHKNNKKIGKEKKQFQMLMKICIHNKIKYFQFKTIGGNISNHINN